MTVTTPRRILGDSPTNNTNVINNNEDANEDANDEQQQPIIISNNTNMENNNAMLILGQLPSSNTTTTDEKTFEEIMMERNRIRKEREEYHVAELKIQISHLENALAAETKRRLDATTKLDESCRTQIHTMEERLKQQLHEDHKRVEERMNHIEHRLQQLEERWNRESKHHIVSIQQTADDFNSALEQLQREQDIERKARLRREGRMLQQVEDHAKEFELRWEQEHNDRIVAINNVQQQVDKQDTSRVQEQSNFQQSVESTLSTLQHEMNLEIEERQIQDEEIVAALNRYTQQLQQSLNMLS